MTGTLVELIFQNLLALFPFTIIKSYQKGVRWSFGRNPIPLEPGIHWKIWVWHQCEVYNVVDEVLDLPVQSVITRDKKLVCFSVNVCFRVVDIVSHVCSVQDFMESTAGLAQTHLAKRVRDKTLAELEDSDGLDDLEKSLKGTLTTKFKAWGTEVSSVGFTNFAEVPRQMRLFLDTNSVLAKRQ